MADFWIKVEKSTPDKPEIFEMAEILNLDPDAVLGKLVRVWSWMDSNSSNGHIKSVTHVLIDRVTHVTGFADAMQTVGWLGNDEIPNFERHLGESAKKRAKNAERKRLSRSSSPECHTKSVTESGLDKSREDKSIDTTSSKADSIPVQQIVDTYHDSLADLPKVKVMTSKRKSQIQQRWRAAEQHQNVEFWQRYFNYVSRSDFLMGRVAPSGDRGKPFRADLEWLTNETNFAKVIEGKYHEQGAR